MFDFRQQKARQLFIGIVSGLLILMLAASTYALRLLQKQKIASGIDLVSTQARIFEDYLTQSFTNIDIALSNTPSIWSAGLSPDSTINLALHNTPYLRSLSLVNTFGSIVASSNPANLGKQIDTQDFLPRANANSEIMRIGPAWQGRDISNGKAIRPGDVIPAENLFFLPVLKKISVDGQTFTLVASVNCDYFINHFSKLIPNSLGHVEVSRLDRTLLFSTDENKSPGSILEALPALSPDDLPMFNAKQYTDNGVDFLTAYQISRHHPFLVLTRLNRDVFLTEWKQQLNIFLSVIGLSIFFIIVLSAFLYKRLLRTADLQHAADEQLNLSAQVFRTSAEAIFIATADLKIFSVNRSFFTISGYYADEVIGRSPSLLYADQAETTPSPAWQQIEKNKPWSGELFFRRKTGECYPAFLTVSCIQDESGNTSHYIGVFSDTTERKSSARFRYLSEHDHLTGLPNRRLFEEQIGQAIARVERYHNRFALLFLDLDNFKQINDTLGHHIGDLLLKEVATRIESCVRATDSICRQGGDEFLVLIEITEDTEGAETVAKKLVETIAQPFDLENIPLNITLSIGIAHCPEHCTDAQCLIGCADIAMYQAKQLGRNQFESYSPEMGQPASAS